MAISLLPTFNTFRRHKYALTHNWTLSITPDMLANPIMAPLLGFVTNILEGYAGGGVNINCTSTTVPKSRVKIIRDVVHGMSIQKIAGREPTATEITLTFMDNPDLRVFKFFEIWKQLAADRFDGNPNEVEVPIIKKTLDARIKEGVVLTLFDDNRVQPRTQYVLLDAYCINANHTDLGSDENFVTTTATIAYLNYEIIDIGLITVIDAIRGTSLLGSHDVNKMTGLLSKIDKTLKNKRVERLTAKSDKVQENNG